MVLRSLTKPKPSKHEDYDHPVVYADGGASQHTFNDANFFVDHVTHQDSEIDTPGGSVRSSAIGTVELEVHNGDEWNAVVLKNSLLVESSPMNMISLGQLACTREIHFSGDYNKTVVYYDNKPIMYADRSLNSANVYEIRARIQKRRVSMMTIGKSLSVWHERFNHVNSNLIVSMANKNLVDGLPEKFNHDVGFCTSCCRGKLTESSHPTTTNKKHVKAGEYIHMDIGGYVKEKSIHNNRYFLFCVDDFSNYVKIFFMKERSETLTKFRRLMNEVRLETGNIIRCLRSDNGSEFTSNPFRKLVEDNGIVHQFATVGVSQQNGKAERNIRTIIEKAVASLSKKDLPNYLWDEAVNQTVYTHNRLLNSAGIVPYTLWFGRKPNVSNLRIFGSSGEMLVKKSGKFDSRSKTVVLMGYEGESIYRCYDRHSKHIELSSSVSWNEIVNSHSMSHSDLISSEEDIDHRIPSDGESTSDTQTGELDENNDDNNVRRGRPSGSKNKKYVANPERLASLRSHKILGLAVAGTVPISFDDASNCEEADKWKLSMEAEYKALIDNDTWELVPRPIDKKVITVKWLYRIKEDGRYKSRLVARGFEADEDNLWSNYAPVVNTDTIRFIFSLIATYDMDFIQFDVSTAFLNGFISHDVYIEQPLGYNDNSDRVCKLKRGLYGLKESPQAWNKRFDDIIKKYGLKASAFDSCLYFDSKNNNRTMLILYVDDGIICSTDKEEVFKIFNFLNRYFKVNEVKSNMYVGFEYHRNRSKRIIHLSQSKYILDKLKIFNMENCKNARSPCSTDDMFAESTEDNVFPYRQAIGSLLYLATKTRPDICYAVFFLARFVVKPLDIHVEALKRIFRYLRGTTNFGIILGGDVNFKFEAFSDADLAGDKSTRKTTTGYCIVVNGPILWRVKVQKVIVDSTAEAEFIACSSCSKDLRYVINMMNELQISFECPTIHVDNQAAVVQLTQLAIPSRLKHIDIKHHMIRQLISENILNVKWIESSKQKADWFTKSLTPDKHERLLKCWNITNPC